ncbi:histidinol-phosphate transaminase [Heyndrickxia sp. NPDC080065]|uniref:histidinol-phosphate transaminase n=1 Tax=Heyndrickxia sp. NPDC080065 TaxID=3390568 RepID=UPI003D005D55
MKWNSQILNLNAYQPGKSIEEVKRAYNLEHIYKLASNENPYGYSNKVKKVVDEEGSSTFSYYPDGYATDLRGELSKFLGIEPTKLIFTNGADELLHIIAKALLASGKNTVMATPTFSQYKHNSLLEGAEVREVPLIDGEHDLNGILDRIDHQTAIVWICSPNNPTGIYISDANLQEFLNQVPKDVLVVLDEAYFDYVCADDYYDALSLVNKYSNLIVVRTFSKIYGLASFRIGYGVASEEIIKALEPVRQPFNTNVLAQKAALAALKDQEFVTRCRNLNREELERFYQFCDQHSLKYYPSQTNFILIDFQCDGDEVFSFLLSKGYIVRSGKQLGAPTCVRISVGTREQNEGVMKAMEAFLNHTSAIK